MPETPKIESSITLEMATSFQDAMLTAEQRKLAKFERKYIVFYATDPVTGVYLEKARTTVVSEPFRPQFTIEYYFNIKQSIKFILYVLRQEFKPLISGYQAVRLATAECTLGELIRSGKDWVELPVTGPREHTCHVRTAETSEEKEKASFLCQATLTNITNLDDNLSKLFCIFERRNTEDDSEEVIYMSEVIVGNTEPVWQPFSLPTKYFHDSSLGQDWALKVIVANIESSKQSFHSSLNKWSKDNYVKIGEIPYIDFETLKTKEGQQTFHVLKEPGKKFGSQKEIGKVILTMRIVKPPTFLDCLDQGMEMNFVVAIDFTAANGEVDDPNSLHYMDEEDETNIYTSAIKAVGDVIQDYDTDKMFPVFGFGARLPDGAISHSFPCNFSKTNPLVEGVDGIIKAYKQSLQKVQLSKPTLINPVIQIISSLAQMKRGGSNYFVLLILTKGDVDDLEDATKTIIDSTRLPLSIVIVGLGDRDFTALKELGEKGRLLEVDGKFCERDIVHFVHYTNPSELAGTERAMISKDFAADVMLEIPDHVLKYMEIASVHPDVATTPPIVEEMQENESSENITVTHAMKTEYAKHIVKTEGPKQVNEDQMMKAVAHIAEWPKKSKKKSPKEIPDEKRSHMWHVERRREQRAFDQQRKAEEAFKRDFERALEKDKEERKMKKSVARRLKSAKPKQSVKTVSPDVATPEQFQKQFGDEEIVKDEARQTFSTKPQQVNEDQMMKAVAHIAEWPKKSKKKSPKEIPDEKRSHMWHVERRREQRAFDQQRKAEEAFKRDFERALEKDKEERKMKKSVARRLKSAKPKQSVKTVSPDVATPAQFQKQFGDEEIVKDEARQTFSTKPQQVNEDQMMKAVAHIAEWPKKSKKKSPKEIPDEKRSHMWHVERRREQRAFDQQRKAEEAFKRDFERALEKDKEERKMKKSVARRLKSAKPKQSVKTVSPDVATPAQFQKQFGDEEIVKDEASQTFSTKPQQVNEDQMMKAVAHIAEWPKKSKKKSPKEIPDEKRSHMWHVERRREQRAFDQQRKAEEAFKRDFERALEKDKEERKMKKSVARRLKSAKPKQSVKTVSPDVATPEQFQKQFGDEEIVKDEARQTFSTKPQQVNEDQMMKAVAHIAEWPKKSKKKSPKEIPDEKRSHMWHVERRREQRAFDQQRKAEEAFKRDFERALEKDKEERKMKKSVARRLKSAKPKQSVKTVSPDVATPAQFQKQFGDEEIVKDEARQTFSTKPQQVNEDQMMKAVAHIAEWPKKSKKKSPKEIPDEKRSHMWHVERRREQRAFDQQRKAEEAFKRDFERALEKDKEERKMKKSVARRLKSAKPKQSVKTVSPDVATPAQFQKQFGDEEIVKDEASQTFSTKPQQVNEDQMMKAVAHIAEWPKKSKKKSPKEIPDEKRSHMWHVERRREQRAFDQQRKAEEAFKRDFERALEKDKEERKMKKSVARRLKSAKPKQSVKTVSPDVATPAQFQRQFGDEEIVKDEARQTFSTKPQQVNEDQMMKAVAHIAEWPKKSKKKSPKEIPDEKRSHMWHVERRREQRAFDQQRKAEEAFKRDFERALEKDKEERKMKKSVARRLKSAKPKQSVKTVSPDVATPAQFQKQFGDEEIVKDEARQTFSTKPQQVNEDQMMKAVAHIAEWPKKSKKKSPKEIPDEKRSHMWHVERRREQRAFDQQRKAEEAFKRDFERALEKDKEERKMKKSVARRLKSEKPKQSVKTVSPDVATPEQFQKQFGDEEIVKDEARQTFSTKPQQVNEDQMMKAVAHIAEWPKKSKKKSPKEIPDEKRSHMWHVERRREQRAFDQQRKAEEAFKRDFERALEKDKEERKMKKSVARRLKSAKPKQSVKTVSPDVATPEQFQKQFGDEEIVKDEARQTFSTKPQQVNEDQMMKAVAHIAEWPKKSKKKSPKEIPDEKRSHMWHVERRREQRAFDQQRKAEEAFKRDFERALEKDKEERKMKKSVARRLKSAKPKQSVKTVSPDVATPEQFQKQFGDEEIVKDEARQTFSTKPQQVNEDQMMKAVAHIAEWPKKSKKKSPKEIPDEKRSHMWHVERRREQRAFDQQRKAEEAFKRDFERALEKDKEERKMKKSVARRLKSAKPKQSVKTVSPDVATPAQFQKQFGDEEIVKDEARQTFSTKPQQANEDQMMKAVAHIAEWPKKSKKKSSKEIPDEKRSHMWHVERRREQRAFDQQRKAEEAFKRDFERALEKDKEERKMKKSVARRLKSAKPKQSVKTVSPDVATPEQFQKQFGDEEIVKDEARQTFSTKPQQVNEDQMMKAVAHIAEWPKKSKKKSPKEIPDEKRSHMWHVERRREQRAFDQQRKAEEAFKRDFERALEKDKEERKMKKSVARRLKSAKPKQSVKTVSPDVATPAQFQKQFGDEEIVKDEARQTFSTKPQQANEDQMMKAVAHIAEWPKKSKKKSSKEIPDEKRSHMWHVERRREQRAFDQQRKAEEAFKRDFERALEKDKEERKMKKSVARRLKSAKPKQSVKTVSPDVATPEQFQKQFGDEEIVKDEARQTFSTKPQQVNEDQMMKAVAHIAEWPKKSKKKSPKEIPDEKRSHMWHVERRREQRAFDQQRKAEEAFKRDFERALEKDKEERKMKKSVARKAHSARPNTAF